MATILLPEMHEVIAMIPVMCDNLKMLHRSMRNAHWTVEAVVTAHKSDPVMIEIDVNAIVIDAARAVALVDASTARGTKLQFLMCILWW